MCWRTELRPANAGWIGGLELERQWVTKPVYTGWAAEHSLRGKRNDHRHVNPPIPLERECEFPDELYPLEVDDCKSFEYTDSFDTESVIFLD